MVKGPSLSFLKFFFKMMIRIIDRFDCYYLVGRVDKPHKEPSPCPSFSVPLPVIAARIYNLVCTTGGGLGS